MRDPLVFIFVLCLLCDGNVIAPKVTPSITCSAGSCEIGQPTSVTCHFHTDVHASKLDFYVTRDNNHVEKSVVMCNWDTKGTIYCVIRDGVHLDRNKVNDRVVVEIPSCQEDQLGLYKCHVISEVDVSTEGCNLTVKDAEKNTSPASAEGENGPSYVYIGIVVGVFILILSFIICFVLVVWLSRKQNSIHQRNMKTKIPKEHTQERLLESNQNEPNQSREGHELTSMAITSEDDSRDLPEDKFAMADRRSPIFFTAKQRPREKRGEKRKDSNESSDDVFIETETETTQTTSEDDHPTKRQFIEVKNDTFPMVPSMKERMQRKSLQTRDKESQFPEVESEETGKKHV